MVYFSDTERVQFIKTFFPQYLSDYSSIVAGAFRSDIWRLLVLYRYGGIYSDLSMQYLSKIEEIVRSDDEFVGVVDLDPKAMLNSFIAAYPEHPLIMKMIEVVMENVHNRRYNCGFLDITGPKALGRIYNAFFGNFENPDIQRGTFTRHGFKIRILTFTTHPTWLISETDSKPNGESVILMRNKFEGYREIVYRNNTPHYSDLYIWHKVFTDESSRNHDKDVFILSYLYRDGKTFRYVHQAEEYLFPNPDLFRAMGFETCMAAREGSPSLNIQEKLPKIDFPNDVLAAVHMVNLWGRANYTYFPSVTSENYWTISRLLTPSVDLNLRSWLSEYPSHNQLALDGSNVIVVRFNVFMKAVEKEALANDINFRTHILYDQS